MRSCCRVDKIPTHGAYDGAYADDTDFDKKVIKFDELNNLTHEDLVLLITNDSSVGKVAFDW